MSQQLTLPAPEATEALGRNLAAALLTLPGHGACIYLHGELGAGKTALARGFLRGCGHAGRVPSPTYTLIESYACAGRAIHHLDLYRLRSADEAEYLGLDELAAPGATLLIEWPEHGGRTLVAPDLEIFLRVLDDGGRACELHPRSPVGAALMAALNRITA
jgi:tRNA threonylcarbamoyladenosine biosynthesis protein TsaE